MPGLTSCHPETLKTFGLFPGRWPPITDAEAPAENRLHPEAGDLIQRSVDVEPQPVNEKRAREKLAGSFAR